MALSASIIILFVFLAGLSIGIVATAIVMSAMQTTTVESSNEPPAVRNSSNPYEPSTITTRVVRARSGCGLVAGVLFVLGALMLAAVVAVASWRVSTVTPAPPSQPIPVGQP